MKKIILFLLLIATINSYSQDYYIIDKDTTFCENLKYTTTAQGYLKQISYSIKGKETLIKGRKNVPDIITFHTDSTTVDKIPLKADKPKGKYIRYTPRVVDGKLKVYKSKRKIVTSSYDTGFKFQNTRYITTHNTEGHAGIYRFFIKFPDGTYYKIDKKKNRKKFIEPYLLKCQKFKEAYTGDFVFKEKPNLKAEEPFKEREDSFKKIIELYNSLCN